MSQGEDRMVCLDDFEKYAVATLPSNAIDYYRSGADEEITLRDNVQAFSRYKILPRVLIDISNRDLSTSILGHRIAFPVCISPTAMQRMAHPEGEIATAKAAQRLGTAYTMSTLSTSSLEEVASAVPDVLRFFQLYIYKNRDITQKLVERAEKNGYKALFLTVDTPFLGKRRADNRNKFKLPPPLRLANFDIADVKSHGVNEAEKDSGLGEYTGKLFDPQLCWNDINWLRKISNLPIVLKGILTGSDAVKAVEAGVDGIVVSNHGARQLDSVPATIDVLSEVVSAVAGRCEVYMDGGVRTGTDVLKALALGAKAVFIGRPVLYSLAYNGAEGVVQMLEILKDEFSRAMAFSGCRNVKEMTSDLVRSIHAKPEIQSRL